MQSEILLQKGRIIYINYGCLAQKYAVLCDFVNTKKVIIDSPNGEFPRQVITVKRIEPTKFRLQNFEDNLCIKEYAQRFLKAVEALSENGKGKLMKVQALRKNLTDLERFKVMVLRRKLSKALRTNLNRK